MDFRVILILIAEALFAFFLLMHAGVLKSRRAVLVSALLIAAAFTVRGLCLDYMTLDYKDFLSKWVDLPAKRRLQGAALSAGELQYPVPLLSVSVLLLVDKRPLSYKAAEHLL